MKVTDIKVAFVDEVLGDIGLSYNIKETRLQTIISLANKSQRSEAKFMTMLPITFRVTAPLAWWIEADTYKVGVRRWSNSVMHSVLNNGLTLEHFEVECEEDEEVALTSINVINRVRKKYKLNEIDRKEAKKRIKKAIGGNYLYTSRITMSYENLRNIYRDRIDHELDWWQTFLEAFKDIPFFEEFIVGEEK